MNIWIIVIGLLTHWVADFVFQTDWEAKNKSINNYALTKHVLKYSLMWLIPIVGTAFFTSVPIILFWFIPITFVCHWVTDYFTSRLNSRLWKTNKVHEFFVSVGFDQVLHYVQLVLTFLLLT
jgi:hypothetical protein